jgi:NTE family protein
MRFLSCTLLSILFALGASGQKVGLVLSGGAAKGLAHIGVLKALEEHEIPIDYIVGTSMGGIIGGCYAAGMSPDQIEHIILSDDFLRWVNGLPEPGYNYFYHEGEVNPNFLRVHLSLDSILNFHLNTSIASDVSLNFVLAEKVAQASAISRNNFDSLFVPLRVVAADIFTQNQVILKNGFLSDALRATQTVPFFYNPIRVNGKYLFDGGVYNNFPVDVAQKEFQPDIIIGSNVSTKIYNEYPYDLDEKLIANSLLFLLLDKSDPMSVPEDGVYIQPDLKGYSSFDFSQAKGMIDSGYVQTLRQIDEIKKKVGATRSCDDVTASRNAFNNQNAGLVFDKVIFKGFSEKQSRYLRRIFHYNPSNPKSLYYDRIKKGYFRLVSEQYFSNIYPNIFFDSLSRKFQFQLTRRPQKNFQVDFGGAIATRDVSNIFLGLNFYSFNNQLIHSYAGFHTGNFYKSALLKTRIDFPFQAYIEPIAAFSSWDYLANNDFINEISNPTVLRRISRSYGAHIGWPIGNIFKSSVGMEGINNDDKYGNKNVFVSSDTLDNLRLSGYKLELAFSASSLNRKQYASAGSAYHIKANYFHLNERFIPGSTSIEQNNVRAQHQWFRVKAVAEQYFNAGWFRPGYYVEGVFSNQPFFQNYRGTIISAPAFYPLQDSRTLLLQNFRAFNYVGAGVRNVFAIRSRLDFRLEGYLFKPFEQLLENTGQEAVTTKELNTVFFTGTAGLVLHSPIGPISLSANYYDDAETQFGVLLHVGFLLFNPHSVE